MTTCPHQLPGPTPGTVTCKTGRYGGTPSRAVCDVCQRTRKATEAKPHEVSKAPARKPCKDDLFLPDLEDNAKAAIHILESANHSEAPLLRERLKVVQGLSFTPCAKKARLHAILERCAELTKETQDVDRVADPVA